MAETQHAHEHSTKPYVVVFVALIALTIVTVGLSYLDLGYAGNKILGFLVAVVKASLVVLIFMHMREDGAKDRYLIVSIVFPLCLFVLIVFALFPDVVYRGGDQAKRFDPGPYDNVGHHAPEGGAGH
ncbi:MAG: cytochrome C oxidase subunit IV family protein [Planctomycetes bacterium]|nr:cytochrome C oxidase subunit IV family protein [Planctomycetota bacterium]